MHVVEEGHGRVKWCRGLGLIHGSSRKHEFVSSLMFLLSKGLF
jgi:hypothetical protein